MGILSDPEAGPSKWAHILIRDHRPFCYFMCIVGYAWFCLLAHKTFNNGNYFSENALLPGLVQSDLVDDGSAKQFLAELEEEIKQNYNNKNSIPIPWLAAKLHQLNLDVYTHNFTLHYPLGKGQTFRGENVYGILRAGRSSSSEALVLSAPYRPASSPDKPTNGGIALMLSIAKFARTRKYWAKDLIFLVTEHEQLGAHAWLKAYHGARPSGALQAGELLGRSGAIQAAINLEMPALTQKYIEVKVEGLNGQLPNLDLVNLVHKMCIKSNVHHSYKTSYSWTPREGHMKSYMDNLGTLIAQITTQFSGVPTGNHGLFHRYGIEAVTLEGMMEDVPGRGRPSTRGARAGHALEGTLRSLNNLLERFHQSFFFYLRPATDRFVSIGQYMPPFGVIVGALFIRAFALWLTTQKLDDKTTKKTADKSKNNKSEEPVPGEEKLLTSSEASEVGSGDAKPIKETPITERGEDDYSGTVGFLNIGVTYIVTHALGITVMQSPQLITEIGVKYFELSTETSLLYGLTAMSVILVLLLPSLLNMTRATRAGVQVLLVLAYMELATLLITASMFNFSLGLCLAAFYVPAALAVRTRTANHISTFKDSFVKVMWIFVHPLMLTFMVVCVLSTLQFPDDAPGKRLERSLLATKQALTFSIVDMMIYGNWLFNVLTSMLFPIWMLFWQVLNMRYEELA